MYLTFHNNRIAENICSQSGGGLYAAGYASSSYSKRTVVRFDFTHNEINGNTADYGGGAYITLARADYAEEGAGSAIQANDINGNVARDSYGGLYLDLDNCETSTLSIVNNVISGNGTKSSTGGIHINSDLANPQIDFINNTVTENALLGFRAIADGSGGVLDNFVLYFSNNTVYGNQMQSYPSDDVDFDNYSDGNMVVNSSSNSMGGLDVNDVTYNDNGENLTTDPLLGDDFHLLAGSPAIDSANAALAPPMDKEGNARVGDPDRGAYEYLGRDHRAELPLPDARYKVLYNAMRGPIVASDPLVARPFTAFIDSTNILKLQIDLPRFSSGVDLYAGVFIPTINPDDVYQIARGRFPSDFPHSH
ncbi:MAG: choice-of-anchor Q domain-containing protein [Deltaproteobacteria bacterium]|nr:choice-of-anchor Q domain-containing protein [Deltaproteobacteria bacterium]